MEIFSTGYALLAAQNALLGVVAPSLRAVVVDVCRESKWLYLYFYYDGDAPEGLIDLWRCAVTEASADLGPNCELDDGVERLDYPRPIPVRGRLAYLRKEPNTFSPPYKGSSETILGKIKDLQHDVGYFVCPVSEKKMSTTWGLESGTCVIPGRPLEYPIEITPVAYALLAVQRAFLKKVTPELRTIVVDVSEESHSLYIHCYYHGQTSEDSMRLWKEAILEAFAAQGSEYTLDAGIHRLDYPQPTPFRGRCAYSWYQTEKN